MSNPPVSRRSLIEGGSTVLVSSLAGCYTAHPPSTCKGLVIYPSTTTDATSPDVEKRGSTRVVHLTLVNESVARTEDGNFHDVRVVAYSREDSLVCSKRVGDVTYENDSFDDGVTARMECSSFPYEITATARETPCDETVEIQLLRYDDERESYRVMNRKCSEERTGGVNGEYNV